MIWRVFLTLVAILLLAAQFKSCEDEAIEQKRAEELLRKSWEEKGRLEVQKEINAEVERALETLEAKERAAAQKEIEDKAQRPAKVLKEAGIHKPTK